MPDFEFLHNPHSHQWVILAPKRASRPDQVTGKIVCPFCPEDFDNASEREVYRVGGVPGDKNWEVRVIANKFPFAPIHEIIVHSPDHHKNFEELPLEHVKKILEVYQNRYNLHKKVGNVAIFHNHGEKSGESIPHPHSQLVVTPPEVDLQVPALDMIEGQHQETNHFRMFCPQTSQWPDEVWIAPKQENTTFGETLDEELDDLAFVLQRLIQIFDIRHGHEFAYNFYISPWKNWYLRLIPRQKRIGGFELATGVYVNTQDPKETIAFIQEHFTNPDEKRILEKHMATYHRGV